RALRGRSACPEIGAGVGSLGGRHPSLSPGWDESLRPRRTWRWGRLRTSPRPLPAPPTTVTRWTLGYAFGTFAPRGRAPVGTILTASAPAPNRVGQVAPHSEQTETDASPARGSVVPSWSQRSIRSVAVSLSMWIVNVQPSDSVGAERTRTTLRLRGHVRSSHWSARA